MIEFLSAPQNAPFLVALVALGAVSEQPLPATMECMNRRAG